MSETLSPLAEVIPAAIELERLSHDIHGVAAKLGWKAAAAALGVSFPTLRALAHSPERCQPGSRALVRQRLTELSALEQKGAA